MNFQKRIRSCALSAAGIAFSVAFASQVFADGEDPNAKSKSKAAPGIQTVGKDEVAKLEKLNKKYGSAKALTMNVKKTLTLGLLGDEKKSSGKLWIANGELRMDLEGAEEKFTLVVNKKNFFAATDTSKQFKGAAVQVVTGDTQSKKAKEQALTSLLSSSGFLKAFKPTGMNVLPTGETVYFLQPLKNQDQFSRAQIKVSKDGQKIEEFKYWDSVDNSTSMEFSDVAFGGKVDPKLFDYTPPANADVMKM
ncbi:MAG TPA: outer-membrane lipoprotein carrier protein LolA [Bdellovibrionales bacterium]|nr:outer-membrane lipoprotein carrier protein LolA [Bdellovibrionales bacterium]